MFKKLLELLTPEGEEPVIGYFVNNNNTRTPAIVETFAINQEVYGVEIVLVNCQQKVIKFTGKAKLETSTWEIYLTQHEYPKSRIERAVELIKNWDLPREVEINMIPAPMGQSNLKRYLISLEINCSC